MADFRALQDEALLVLARQGCHAAFYVLRRRHRKWMNAFIARWVRRRLRAHQLPEAQQAGRLAFMEALERYDLEQLTRKRPCRFRTYLQTKVRSRLQNLARSNRRQKVHCLAAENLQEEADRRVEKSYVADKHDIWSASKLGDPALLAERRELELRIAQAISRLDSRYAQVWQGYCADKTNRQIARETGLSISTVKRMLGVLRSTLQAVMEEDNS